MLTSSSFLSSPTGGGGGGSLSAPIPIIHHHQKQNKGWTSSSGDFLSTCSSSSAEEIARSANSAFFVSPPTTTTRGGGGGTTPVITTHTVLPHHHTHTTSSSSDVTTTGSSSQSPSSSSPSRFLSSSSSSSPTQQQQQKKSRSVDDDERSSSRHRHHRDPSPLSGRRSPAPPPPAAAPPTTLDHIAGERDTLTSIAARYEVTPSEIIKLNRLATRAIFPGQLIRVPIKLQQQMQQQQLKSSAGSLEGSSEEVFSEEKVQRKFVKLNVRHITDGNGVVSGTLLVTPNAVMFDPNVSDPLVLEQGAETYGVILPLEVVVHAGIFSDIAHMKVRGNNKSSSECDCGPLPFLYPNTAQRIQPPPPATSGGGPAAAAPPPSGSSPRHHEGTKDKVLKRLSFPLTWMSESLSGSGGSSSGDSQQAKSAPPTGSDEEFRYGSSEDINKKRDVVVDQPPPAPLSSSSPPTTATPPPSSSLDEDQFTWYLCLSTGRPREGWKSSSSSCRPGLMVSYGVKGRLYPEYWFHLVSPNDVREIYAFWMTWWPHTYAPHLDQQLLSSRGYEAVDWDTMDEVVQPTAVAAPPPTTAGGGPPGSSKESWEMLKSPFGGGGGVGSGGPKALSSYLLTRSQTLLTSTSSSATNFGQGILDSLSDFTSLSEQPDGGDGGGDCDAASGEMSDELRLALLLHDNDDSRPLPELLGGPSQIFKDDGGRSDHRRRLINRNLTARADGYPWSLLFSSEVDGFSLSTLYRKMPPPEELTTPLLLVVEDVGGRVFGALLSNPLRPSDVFYGTGQSFLFNICSKSEEEGEGGEGEEEIKVWRWTGDNLYFVRGGVDSSTGGGGPGGGIFIGAGDGRFGLWLDGDLNRGRSDECPTYGNPPLVPERDFTIKTLECFAFVERMHHQQQRSISCEDGGGGGGVPPPGAAAATAEGEESTVVEEENT